MHGTDEESSDPLRTALNVLPFRVAILGSTGTIVQANEQWRAFAGAPATRSRQERPETTISTRSRLPIESRR